MRPADNVRPGEAGVILEGRVRPVHLTATLVDLAARGYLSIQEVPGQAGRPDWILSPLSAPGRELRPYESVLLFALFANRDAISVSQLYFAADGLCQAKEQLKEDVTAAGWFLWRPGLYDSLLERIGFTTQRTPQGVELRARLASFRDHVRSSAGSADPGQPLSSPSVDPAYLVLFGLENQWDLAPARTGHRGAGGGPDAPSARTTYSLYPFARTVTYRLRLIGRSFSSGHNDRGRDGGGGSFGDGGGDGGCGDGGGGGG